MESPLIVLSPFCVILDNWERCIYILIILLLSAYILFFKANINIVNKTEGLINICGYKLTTKDFIYTHLIVLFFMVVIVTSKYADSEDLVRYVSFATTIVSLFLSLIAIILSIVSLPQVENIASTMNSSVESLNSSAMKICEFQEKVNSIAEESNNLSKQVVKIDKLVKVLEVKINSIGDDVGTLKQNSFGNYEAEVKDEGENNQQNDDEFNSIENLDKNN